MREEFERLNRAFRGRILQSADTRGVILDTFFEGYEGIEESEAGRAFSAFFQLLTNPRASADFEDALNRIVERDFYRALSMDERRRLANLQNSLVDRAGSINAVMTQLARSLKDFVQTRSYVEERRLGNLIREARRAALDLSKTIGVKEGFLPVTLPSAQVRSIDQYILDDSEEMPMEVEIGSAGHPEVDALAVFERILAAEIDYPALMRTVEALLAASGAPERVSIGEVYGALAVKQGLGSVVGLLSLATRYGAPGAPGMPGDFAPDAAAREAAADRDMAAADYVVPEKPVMLDEALSWRDRNDVERSARIPLYWFTMASVERMRASHRWR